MTLRSKWWPALLAALADGDQPAATLDAVEKVFRAEVGAKLFTVMLIDAQSGLARRIHTNDPDAYPVAGAKPLSIGPWSRRVIDARQLFVANDIAGIAEVFPDHELICSLGCESVVNVPVVFADQVIGTVNMLDRAGYYTPERVAAIEALSPFAAVALIAARLTEAFATRKES
jgi:GAF domain-containing protein